MNTVSLGTLPAPPPSKQGWPWTEASPPLPATMSDGTSWPRITIVTPSYNQGAYLEETIRSVLLQRYPNLEYIVMDGGSTDGSVEIIEKYAPWITYWESEPDRGQSHAINKGFARATGEIMAWLNSDDVYSPGVVFRVADLLKGHEDSILVGLSIVTDGPNSLKGAFDRRMPSWKEMVYEAKTFPQPSVFWTQDLWKKAGPLDEDFYYAMDYALWLRMVWQAEFVLHQSEIFSCARTHPNQKTNEIDPESKRRFRQQWVESAIRGAQYRGERPVCWLMKAWLYHVLSAISERKMRILKGSTFLRYATRRILIGNSHA